MNKNKLMTYIQSYKYIVFDTLAIILSYLITIWVISSIGINPKYEGLIIALIIIVPFKILVYLLLGFYKMITKHTGFEDIFRIILGVIVTNIAIMLFIYFTKLQFMYEPAYLFIILLEITGIIFTRILRKALVFFSYRFQWVRSNGPRTLIIGAGYAAEIVIKEIYKNKDINNLPIGLLDDDLEKKGRQLLGVDVLGSISNLEAYVYKFNIEEVIIAIKDLKKDKLNLILEQCFKLHVKVKRLNVLNDVGDNPKNKIVEINVEDLLNREVIHLDNEKINEFIQDEIVLITGGGGSIGSELSRQIFDLKPKKLIIFDIYENNAYDIQMELIRKASKNKDIKYPELEIRIGSVYNKVRLEEIYKEFNPTIVFHAAAYKHVPLMEDSPIEAIRTNILGTYNSATLATKYNVKKFVLVSSDKAVRSTNVMGATKRCAEMIIKKEQSKSKTIFSAVRFGNVLGSNGSVIPLFKKQINDGGPITVTHKDITRYFMTIPEAVGLILQCGVFANDGELFILDMGDPVKIYDLAEKMIRLAGLRPGVDIKIEIIGLRPGEKLYEELLFDKSNPELHKTMNNLIFIEKDEISNIDIEIIEDLIKDEENYTSKIIKEKLSDIVNTYVITNN